LTAAGVPQGRLLVRGVGDDQPRASNLTPDGRAQNRRVEIIIRPSS
jgi:outer membrane protein OmpA-like peptidoglycan-associated protein